MINPGPANQQLILQAMISIASADGEIDAREMAAMRYIYAKETGEDVSAGDVARAARGLDANSASPAEALCSVSATMDKATKEALLCSCYQVLLADGRVAARERKKLQDFVSALKVSEIHLSVILEDMSRSD